MKTEPNDNEQWLLDGICRKCRRRDYCAKPCKRNEIRIQREAIAFIREKTGLGRIMDALDTEEETK